MSDEPDHDFDGYLCLSNGHRFLCSIQIWLPHEPSADGGLRVVVMGACPDDVVGHGLVTLTSQEAVEARGFRFEAREVLIRSGRSQAFPRRTGGTELAFTHVGSWRLEQGAASKTSYSEDGQTWEGPIEAVTMILSSLKYAAPPISERVDHEGNRRVRVLVTPKVLRFVRSSGEETCAWELQRNWHWHRQVRGQERVIATSFPVLQLTPTAQVRDQISREALIQLGDDTCVLLSLAARHRVVIHAIKTCNRQRQESEWREPLRRSRCVTEEEACGPLIDEEEIGEFFVQASRWWYELDEIRKDAVRLAIFAINRLTEGTLDSRFTEMFYALEGLAKRWGEGKTFRKKIESMHTQYPARFPVLWPIVDESQGQPLYWIRNEIAHGRRVMRFAPGALPLACDHLQLWLEHTLLALMGYRRARFTRDWLSNQALRQREAVVRCMMELRVQANSAPRLV